MKQKILEQTLCCEEESKAFAAQFCKDFLAPALCTSSVQVSLCGPLGAGKTFLSREIIAFFTEEKKANSPSYALCNIYEGKDLHIEHWDLYRLSQPEEELFEMADTGVLRLIEWADKFEEVRRMGDFEIVVELGGKNGERGLVMFSW